MAAKKVYGVKASAIDNDCVVAALEKLELPTDGEDDDRVGRLVAYFRENTAQANLCKCDVCDGKSDATAFDDCPYCGTGDEATEAEAATPEPEAPEAEPELPLEQPKAPAKGKATKAAKGKAPAKKAPAKKAPAKGKATKGKKAELVTVDVDPKFKVSDLDAAVQRANDLTRAGAVVAYELGVQLQSIHKDQLWKLRKAEDGTPAYKSFESFVMQELEISRQTAYEQIDVSSNYQKGDVEKLGYKKLALLLKAPKEVQPALKTKAEGGASFRELQSEVKNARAEAGVTQRDTGRKATPKGKAPKGGKGETITVAALLGKQTVPLYKSLKKTKNEEIVAAQSLDDEPWGMIELRNGVVEVFHITKNSKGLVLQVKRERQKKPSK